MVFGLLGGVRGGKPIFTPRGFPKDASLPTKVRYGDFGPDAHTPCWLTFKDFVEVCSLEQKAYGKDFEVSNLFASGELKEQIEDYTGLKVAYFLDYKDRADDVRIVFWFDN